MAVKVDVAVIGAGLGGLSAAAVLANRGLSVLLLERHHLPGGYASSFLRGRYEFEVSLHELSGVGPGGGLLRYLDDLGVARRLEFLPIQGLYRSVFPGLDLALPSGREAYEAALVRAFPHQARGVGRFLDRVCNLGRETAALGGLASQGRPGLKDILAAPFRFSRCLRYFPVPWGQVLQRDVTDPRAQAVLSQYWGYFGLPPSKVSFLYFAAALASYLQHGASFVKGRSQALSNAFVSALEEKGGHIRLRCPVQRIIVRQGRVRAVAVAGEEIEVGCVVSNASPISTCLDLIGPDHIPPAFLRRLGGTTVGPSTMNVYIGVGRPLDELTDHETFINSDYDLEAHHGAAWRLVGPPSVVMTHYNAVYPAISPPGTAILVLTAISRGEPWYAVRPQQYEAIKAHMADAMIALAEGVVPHLRDHIEVVSVSTPITNMRFAGTLGGSIYGFDQPPHQSTILRPPPRAPLKGLYFAGAWTQPGGGFEPSIMSGLMAARAILSDRQSGHWRES